MSEKIKIENLVKIFGPSPEKKALPMLMDGASKQDIQDETGHVVGVADVSFTVQKGEVFVVMGLSGSGKSTLIRCVNRLIEPTSGHIYIDDEDVVAFSKKQLQELRRKKVAMVFQHFALFPHMTIIENVAYGMKVRGIEADERRQKAIEAIDLVGLKGWEEYRPNNLSGGMQQRVGLARALATEADVLLMDEAFSALDPLIRKEMQDELIQLQDRLHKTVLFITHDLDEALRVGNHIAVLQQDGRLAQIGTPVEIITQPANDYVAEFTQNVDISRVLTAAVVMKPIDDLVVPSRASIQKALDRLNTTEADALYMMNGTDELKGLLLKQDLLEAADDSEDVKLSQIAVNDFPQTHPSATLMQIYDLCAAGLPVAVVDEQSQLKGIIDPLDVLAKLGSRNISKE